MGALRGIVHKLAQSNGRFIAPHEDEDPQGKGVYLGGLFGLISGGVAGLMLAQGSMEALDEFADWWEGSRKDKWVQEPIDFVVYGHTHLADVCKGDEISGKIEKAAQRAVSLTNIPASSKEHEPVVRDAALCIDEQSPKFIGWNWGERKLFYIHDEITRLRADRNALDHQMIQELLSIGWPDEMLEKWRTLYRQG